MKPGIAAFDLACGIPALCLALAHCIAAGFGQALRLEG